MVATCPPVKKKKDIYDIFIQGKIEFNRQDTSNMRNDLDTRIIDALGNRRFMNFTDGIKHKKLQVGRTFSVNINNDPTKSREFKILAYKASPNGFNGAVIQDLSTGENILWADGTKGVTAYNLATSTVEIIIDWLNDILGIGSGSVFPQLQSLYDFANECMDDGITIKYGIGQSMMGVGMSALAFAKGFENIEFRTYSGCLREDLLEAVKEKWGLNDKNGSNLKSYFTPGEPLLNVLQPVILKNKIYMKEDIDPCYNGKVHSAPAYNNYDMQDSLYYEIERFDPSKFPGWSMNPHINVGPSMTGTGIGVFININTDNFPKNQTMKPILDLLKEMGISPEQFIDENGKQYQFYDMSPIMTANGVTRCDINPNQNPETPDLVIPEDKIYIYPLDPEDRDVPQVKLRERNYKPIKDPIHEIPDIFDDSTGTDPIETDPIILDLNGDGIRTTNTQNGIYFDHEADGFAEKSSWISNEDGILVVDKNDSGIIENGTEILGENFVKANGEKAVDAFDALNDFDSNFDGIIDSTDELFSSIKIQKGDGSLISLEEAGILSLNLSNVSTNVMDENGNTQIRLGSYTKADGSTGTLGSYYLNVHRMDSVATDILDLSDEVSIMPDILGAGKVYDLQQAIMRDETGDLKTLVNSFSSSINDSQRMNIVEEILIKWTGSTNIVDGSRGENVDAKRLAIVEKFVGLDFYSTYNAENNLNPENPNKKAGRLLNTAYDKIKIFVYGELASQTFLKEYFSEIDYYLNLDTGKIECNLDNLTSTLKYIMDQNQSLGKELVFQVSKMIKGLEMVHK